MTHHQHALAWALAQLGKGEAPPGSNTGAFVRDCQAATWLPGTRWPWCVGFFMRAWVAAGVTLPWRGAGAFAFYDWAKTADWTCASGQAQPGDAVIVRTGAGHCGMLSDPVNGTAVPTINGNWGDAVTEHTFHLSEVLGFIHIPADPKVIRQTKPAKPRMFEVATSASGHKKLVYVSGPRAIGKKLPQLLNRYGGLTIRRRKH
jgi:hypothetical protein